MTLILSHKLVAESATISTPSVTETTKVAAALPRQTSRLSGDEKRMLQDLEVVFVSEGRVSLGAAKALHLIKEKRLYLGHGSMTKYGAIWGYSSAYTSRLTKSGAVYFSLEPLWRDEGWPEPTSAWQLKPLSDLKKVSAQKATWRKAVRLSQGAAPAATVVEECVDKLLGRAAPKPAKEFLVRLDLTAVDGLAEAASDQAQRKGVGLQQVCLNALAEYYHIQRPHPEEIRHRIDGVDLMRMGFFRAQ